MQRQIFRRDREPITWVDRVLGVLWVPLGAACWVVLLWQPLRALAALFGWH